MASELDLFDNTFLIGTHLRMENMILFVCDATKKKQEAQRPCTINSCRGGCFWYLPLRRHVLATYSKLGTIATLSGFPLTIPHAQGGGTCSRGSIVGNLIDVRKHGQRENCA